MNYDAILKTIGLVKTNLETQLTLLKENLKVLDHFEKRIKELKELKEAENVNK